MPAGRPSLYNEEIAEEICGRLAEGQSLVRIAGDNKFPDVRTIFRWLDVNESFRQRYARARETQAEVLADIIIETALGSRADTAQADRVRIDGLKWTAMKLLPKKYGEKVTQEHTGADGGPLTVKWVKPEGE